tara:strand:+ start:351 stop:686 length:336 start_codon:yes stop_codon:yes gene_type:complete
MNTIPNPLPRIKINENLNAPIPRNIPKEKNFKDMNNQLDEITNILNDNIDKTINNMENTLILSESTDKLREQSNQFNKTSKKVKRKMYFKNKKLQIILGIVVIVIIIIVCI